jgi:hypothetical protein
LNNAEAFFAGLKTPVSTSIITNLIDARIFTNAKGK